MAKLSKAIKPIIGLIIINIKGNVNDNKNIIGIKCLRLKDENFLVINTVKGIHNPFPKLFNASALYVSRAK